MANPRRVRKPSYSVTPATAAWESPIILRRLSPKRPPSLSELAETSGMYPGTLSRILCRRREPTLRSAARIARALRISLDRLHEVLSAA